MSTVEKLPQSPSEANVIHDSPLPIHAELPAAPGPPESSLKASPTSFPFTPGSTIIPRRHKSAASASSLPSLLSDISSSPSTSTLLATPLSSSLALSEAAPACIKPPAGLHPPMTIPPNVIFEGVKRVSEGRDAGQYPAGWWSVPYPTSTSVFTDGSEEFEELDPFLCIRHRHSESRRSPGLRIFKAAVPDSLIPPSPTSTTPAGGASLSDRPRLYRSLREPMLSKEDPDRPFYKPSRENKLEGVFGGLLDKVHYGKETVQNGGKMGWWYVKTGARMLVGRRRK